MKRHSEPVFNVPVAVLICVAVLGAIHVLRMLLPVLEDQLLVIDMGFVPARITAAFGGDPLQSLAAAVEANPRDMEAIQRLALGQYVLDGGQTKAWTALSYALLHGGWTHLVINSVWLMAFGTAVARRFGTQRFIGFLAVSALGGAIGHWIARPDDIVPMIGASAAISGCMAGAIRFVFQPGAPLGIGRAPKEFAYRLPALPLLDVLRDSRVLIFLAVWFGLNLITGIGGAEWAFGDISIAWEAHLGGFLVGLITFALFDPRLHP